MDTGNFERAYRFNRFKIYISGTAVGTDENLSVAQNLMLASDNAKDRLRRTLYIYCHPRL